MLQICLNSGMLVTNPGVTLLVDHKFSQYSLISWDSFTRVSRSRKILHDRTPLPCVFRLDRENAGIEHGIFGFVNTVPGRGRASSFASAACWQRHVRRPECCDACGRAICFFTFQRDLRVCVPRSQARVKVSYFYIAKPTCVRCSCF